MNLTQEKVGRIFREPPILETNRLMLRKMLKSDASDMYEYASRSEVTEYLLWSPHESEASTRRYLSYLQGRYRAGDFYDWAVTLRTDGKMIGTCGFTRINTDYNCAEIGYVLNNDYWGNGYAPEAVRKVLEFGFMTLGLHRIEAKYMAGNDRSRRVMEKAGMQFEGFAREAYFVKEHYVTVGTCAILEDEFKKLYGYPQYPGEPQEDKLIL